MERLDESDWGDSLDDAEGSDWAYFLGGPDDEAFEQAEDAFAQGSVDGTPYDDTDESDKFVIRRPKENVLMSSVTTAFNYALKNKDYALLREMLESGFPPDVRRHRGRTALMRAAYTDDIELAELLIEYGANIFAEDEDGNTPLSEALQVNGRAEAVFVRNVAEAIIAAKKKEAAIEASASQNTYEPESGAGVTIPFSTLQLLLKHNMTELLADALAVGFDTFGEFRDKVEEQAATYFSIEAYRGHTETHSKFGLPDFPVHDVLFELAIDTGNAAAAELLIEDRMTRLTTKDERLQQLTPGQRDLLLQKNIADKEWLRHNKQELECRARARLSDETEDICEWVEADRLAKLAGYLFKHPGVCTYMPNGELTFEFAYKRKLIATPILVAHGLETWLDIAKNDPDQLVFDNRTALSLAAEFGLNGICRALLEFGADPNAPIYQGTPSESPLAVAALSEHVETCRLLREQGASLDWIYQLKNNRLQFWFAAYVEPISYVMCSLPLDPDDDIPF